MIFDSTNLPSLAAQLLAQKGVLPTQLSSAQLRELAAVVRNQSLFSARTTLEYLLAGYQKRIGGILHPVPAEGGVTTPFNPAYVRAGIKDLLAENGYQPDEEDRGTIKDLSSDARINLVVKTNVELMEGQGMWMATQQPALLDEWPAWELFRAEARVKVRDWINRFRLAGGQTGDPMGTGWTITQDNRMIALKNHAIWEELGSSENFDDALDTVWPPFAFNSGMWVRNVDRTTTESIGLIKRGQTVKPLTLADVLKPAEVAA